jgi:hypothetical protein
LLSTNTSPTDATMVFKRLFKRLFKRKDPQKSDDVDLSPGPATQVRHEMFCDNCSINPFRDGFHIEWAALREDDVKRHELSLDGIKERECLWCNFLFGELLKRQLSELPASCVVEIIPVEINVPGTRPNTQGKAFGVGIYDGTLGDERLYAKSPLVKSIGEVIMRVQYNESKWRITTLNLPGMFCFF